MKRSYCPLKKGSLLAAALSGIMGPAAQAVVYSEPPDFSNSSVSPTVLGAFDPALDVIVGSVTEPLDFTDAVLLTGSAGTPVSIPITMSVTNTTGYFTVYAYDDAGGVGTLGNIFTSTSGVFTVSFSVPADGDYMLAVSGNEGGGLTYSYTLGSGVAVPEPGAALGLGLAAAAGLAPRRRRDSGTA